MKINLSKNRLFFMQRQKFLMKWLLILIVIYTGYIQLEPIQAGDMVETYADIHKIKKDY